MNYQSNIFLVLRQFRDNLYSREVKQYFSLNTILSNNTLLLLFSSLLSQVLLLIGTIFFVKLYDPFQFGSYAFFISVVNLLSVFSTGKYEQAILLPKEEKDSFSLVFLSFFFSFLFSLILLFFILIVFILTPQLLNESKVIFLAMPAAIFITSLFNTFTLFLNRLEVFKVLAFITLINSVLIFSLNLIFGFLSFHYGLIYSYVLSQLFIVAGMVFFIRYQIRNEIKFNKKFYLRIYLLAKQYSSFPKISIWYYFITTLNQSFSQIIYGLFFGKSILGFYSIANRILRAPFLLIVGSIGNVFRVKISKYASDVNLTRVLYKKTFKKLMIFSICTLVPFIIFSKSILVLILGEKWGSVSEYCNAIVLLVFFEILEVPLSYIYIIRGKPKYQLVIQLLNIVGGLFIFFILVFFTRYTFLKILYFISFYSIVVNGFSLFLTYKLTYNVSN